MAEGEEEEEVLIVVGDADEDMDTDEGGEEDQASSFQWLLTMV